MKNAESIHVRLQQDGPIPLNVSLSCNTGKILVILGPSGSGKTTILRAVSGLYTPESGNIRCHGEQWLDTAAGVNLPVQQRRIGMVFQHYALFPHKTALQNIMIALQRQTPGSRHDSAEKLLRTMNMEGLGERYPHQLSGGQQQRVALARALARDPGVLLLDEPFSAVDQQTRRKLVRELVILRQQFRLPVIHVTHDLNEARRIADRLCVIHRGKTLQSDTPDRVMNHPDSADVASLIGSSAPGSPDTTMRPEQPVWNGTDIPWTRPIAPNSNPVRRRTGSSLRTASSCTAATAPPGENGKTRSRGISRNWCRWERALPSLWQPAGTSHST